MIRNSSQLAPSFLETSYSGCENGYYPKSTSDVSIVKVEPRMNLRKSTPFTYNFKYNFSW